MAGALAAPQQVTLRGTAKEAFDKLKGKVSEFRDENKDLLAKIAGLEGALQNVVSQIPSAVGPTIAVAVEGTASYAGGYLDELAIENKWDRMGPVPTVPLMGVAIGIASLTLIADPNLQAGGLALAKGLAMPALADMGRKKRREHKAAMDAKKAKDAAEKKAA